MKTDGTTVPISETPCDQNLKYIELKLFTKDSRCLWIDLEKM
jgi:hypothetical protein